MLEEMQGFRLSPQQKHLWQLQEINSLPYRSQCAVLIEGVIDINILKQALEQVVNRHEILRTNFHCLPGMSIPLQVITNKNITWGENYNFSSCSHQQQEELSSLFEQFNQEVFDLQHGSLLRLSLVTLSSEKYILLICLPALCADAASLNILVREISQAYAACFQGKELDNEPLQYADLAEWQNELLEGEDTEAGRDYWRKQNITALTTLKLPWEQQTALKSTFQPQIQSINITPELVAQIEILVQRYNTTVSHVLLACWQILIWRITQQSNVIIGIGCDGRNYQELQDAIGLFAKFLPINIELDKESTLIEIISKNNLTDIFQYHPYFNWGNIADLAPNNSRFSPLCFEFLEQSPKYANADSVFSIYQQYSCIEKFNLKLTCIDNHQLTAEFHYNSNLFNSDYIKVLAGQFNKIVASAIAHPELPISQLEIISDIERTQLLYNHNKDYPKNLLIHKIFEVQVQKTPDRIAVVFEEEKLTYQQLNQKANQLAHYLQKQGVGAEILVGICLERSIDMIVSILGILKAGGAYIALDPGIPPKGLASRLKDIQASFLITNTCVANRLSEVANIEQLQVINLAAQWQTITHETDINPHCQTNNNHLAYILFTSGSTGKPKGVAIEHQQILNYVYAIIDSLKLPTNSTCNFALVSTLAADLGNTVLFPALCTGGCLHIISYDRATDPVALTEYCHKHPIDCLKIVPSHLSSLLLSPTPQSILPRQRLILGGEATNWQLVEQIRQLVPNCQIFNHYGPTESTVGVLTHLITEVNLTTKTVPLGKSIANTQVYILDNNLHLTPIGIKGEIYIGGAGLARCYMQHPELTADKFIPNYFSPQPGARLYKTGDLGRYLPDGTIEFIGRSDYQVKIRGFRIELTEIEAVLRQHPSVKEAVIVAPDLELGQKYLAAYVVPSQESSYQVDELRSYLRTKLPDYMLPSTFIMLKALPLTPSGKIDRQALPALDQVRPETAKFVAPRTPIEEVLGGIWSEILGIKQVGIHDSFFDLGGHSLLATQVASQVREAFQVELRLRSLFETPTIAGLAELIETAMRSGQNSATMLINQVKREDELPLSFAQQRLWFLNQMEPDNPFYNISRAVLLKGSLNVAALEQSINEIVRRHEVLRTSFRDVDGQAVQEIAAALNIKLLVIDLEKLSPEEQQVEIRRLASSQARQAFNLTEDALLRTSLLRLQEEEHVLVFTIHHIVADGWSAGVIVREVAALYESFSSGKPSSLPDLTIQYADFAIWQRQWLQTEVHLSQMAYWKQQLGKKLPVLQLPTDRPRPAIQTFRGRKQSWQIPKVLTEALKSLSRQEAVTLFMTLLAAFKTLLYRYTNQADILIGSPIANRNRSEIEPLIGCFVNTLVLRTDLSSNPSFKELLRRVREVTLDAYAHQDLPFEQLVEELQPERDLSHTPLFQVMLILQNAPMEVLKLPGVILSPMEVETETAMFDITLFLTETEQGLMGVFEYNSDLFDAATISRMQGHFQILLEGIVANPDRHLSDLPILTATEQQQLLVDWNQTSADYPSSCIHQLFEAQVEQTPNSIAVVFEDQQLTYQELNIRANQLAQYLQELGVVPFMLVGICVERSLDMVVGLLGILKAGGAYVPLDPAYPHERLAFMLEDAQVSVLLTQQKLMAILPKYQGKVVYLDTDWQKISEHNCHPISQVTIKDLAYVIYTSGSTGKPKGVQIPHRALVNFLSAMRLNIRLTQEDILLSVTTLSFDIAALEIYLPLIVGARLIVVSREVAIDGTQLLEKLVSSGTTVIQATPATWRLLLAAGWQGRWSLKILCGGEALDRQLANQLLERGTELWNLYGPTETTIWSAAHQVEATNNVEGRDGIISIGRPIANTEFYILDENLQPVPVGVPGELHIGGVGLALGYLNQPELTVQKFIPNPFNNTSTKRQGEMTPDSCGGAERLLLSGSRTLQEASATGGIESLSEPSPLLPFGYAHGKPAPCSLASFSTSRLYKTGDLVRYRLDGTIEYLGRIDHQVKIRGFRIELGEIETLLSQNPEVQQAVVLMQESQPDNKRLIAYIVPNLQSQNLNELGSGTPKPGNFYASNPLKPKWTSDLVPQLRRFLQEKLPKYMVPSAFVTLEALPLTPNGKVDRRSLSASSLQVESEETFVAPSTPVEEMLAGIWAEVLALEKVGIHDNFFELGGHSLVATRVISQIQKVFEIKLPLHRLFEKPTVAKLATEIEKASRADLVFEAATIERISRSHELPLSFAQQRLWFLTQLEPKSPSYNMPAAIRLEGQLNLTALQNSFNEILCRHEALRTNFQTVEGRPVAIIAPVTALPLSVIDLSELPFVQQDATTKQLALVEAQQTFDLQSDVLLRVKLLRLSEQEYIVLVTMHHIASDGWSIGVLVREVTALYQAFCNGQPSPLPELPIQYVDFAVWQRQWLQGEVLQAQLAYWKQQLGNNLPVLQLPTARPRQEVKTNHGATQTFIIPSHLSIALQAISRQQGVTLFMTLLAGFQILLQRYTNQDDIVVGTDVANRNRAETEQLIGFFVNLLVLRIDLSGNPSFQDLLKRVRQVALGAYAHQDLPFEELVKALQPERNLSNTSPLFQVLFVLQNAPMPPLELPGLTLSLLEVEHKVARFDLALFITETDQGISGKWQYNSELFDSATITRMTGHFQTLLNSIISQPDARISNLEMLTEAEKKQQAMQKKERKAFNQKKLIGITPKAVSLLPERLVKTNYLQPQQTFPLVIQPATNDIDLVAWAKTNQEFIQTELLKHGAILFRGFNVESISEFESFAQAISPELFGEYGDLPRTGESGKVYGSTPYPAEKAILFHNESSHLHQWPLKIWFFCVQPAQQGGETPIIDCRQAYKIINPKLRERLDRKQLMYVRHYTNGLDVSWQNFFRTHDKSTVENYCRHAKIDFEWYDNNSLITRQIRPALAVHPKTSEPVFFNQIQLHHIAYLDPEVRESLLSTFGDEKLPRNVYYGDGTPIEDSAIAEINEVYQQSQTSFLWQKSDILMLDNMLTAHGRNPYLGYRKVVVAMAEMIH
ncbi:MULTISPECIES: non-ribosomal peptide synthetase [unclassified Nostoc]|uniref:non-ribosomal peptide synthetase n=1 Tax=unclassified Nostoc TaxID=2593658 RepID=UPI002AD2E449|nr:non-ribosomal peptide synthetase [Nostoc sp. DedQUE03]MDZ7975472.1 amino acid adenylation domain-containing protein [Nostoc sp. DedQUE03]MDZ8045520.1 amino acid adenylation domain-containing protein [Nostoc sp. DedQUE02]